MLTTRMSEDTCRSRFIKYTLDVLSQNKSHKKNWLWAFSTSVPSRSREDPFQISTSIYFISQLWMRIQTPSTDFPWKQNPKIQHHGFSLSCSCSMDSLGGKYLWNVLNYAAMLWKNNSLFYEQESQRASKHPIRCLAIFLLGQFGVNRTSRKTLLFIFL